MSNQLVITSGAKVRSLEGVITGSTGVLNSLPINGSNGIPQLDSNGKILVSQLPNSVMEYKGTWDAATNTPTLANGTGNQGDVYLCNVAGTVNFGAGPITFFVGDQVIYSGTIWQRASGASGTVTSVAVTESGDALSITGSPITTSGTINIGFAGTSAQYVAGDGSLITFPSLTGYVPYTGATANLDLGTFNLTADVITGATGSFASSGGSDTFAINHSSGSGIALNITKGGNGEGLYINKTSGSGNAATIIGTLNATTLVKSGGTSSQFLKADGSVDSNTYLTTSAAASTYLPLTGGTLSGLLNISTASYLTSRLKLTNTATGGNIWSVSSGNANNSTNNGLFSIINETLGKNIFSLSPTGNIIIGEDVGTANPAYNLQVIGTNTVIKATDISGNNSNVTLQASNSAAYLSAGYATTAIPLIFQTGNTTRLTIASTGEATLTGALNGTSATFSGSVVSNKIGSATNAAFVASAAATVGFAWNRTDQAADAKNVDMIFDGTNIALRSVNDAVTSATTLLNIVRSTGAATFSSSVTVNGTVAIKGSNALYLYNTDNTTISAILNGGASGVGDMSFYTGGSQKMILNSSGNVGIGTSSPNGKFNVSNGGAEGIEFWVQSATATNLMQSYNRSTSAWNSLEYKAADHIFYGSGTERMRITSGGDVCINTTTSSGYKLNVNGSSSFGSVYVGSLGTGLVYSSSGTLTSTNPSDERLKDNINDINWGLSDILKLRPVSYHWKNDKINQGIQFGFIAQEVQEVMPEAIKEFGEDVKYLGLEKDAIYAALVNAIKELEARLKTIENKIK